MSYWEKRFERLKKQEMKKADVSVLATKKQYREALTKLRKEILDWYYRYADENEISLAAAKKTLNARELAAFKMELDEYRRLAKQKGLSKEYEKILDQASIRARLDRSQELYIRMVRYVEELAQTQETSLDRLLQGIYKDSVYKTAYEAQGMRGEYGTFAEVGKKDIETAVRKPWANDGKDFSSRIWENKQQLTRSLQTEMTRSFMLQEGVAPLINRIQKRFNVSYNNARRLIETESAYVQERAMLDTYDMLDVEQYQILAVLDLKTSDICQHLDGKVFDRKDAKPGITMPPFHCYCRSTTVPYIEGITDGEGETRIARDPKTGKSMEVPATMTYEKWYNKYIKAYTEPTGQGTYNFDSNGKIIPTKEIPVGDVYRTKTRSFENEVIVHYTRQGKQKNYDIYDEHGFITKQIHLGHHGAPKHHNVGTKEKPEYNHGHDWKIADGKITKPSPKRKLSDDEKKVFL